MKKEAEQVFMFACFYYTCQQNNRAEGSFHLPVMTKSTLAPLVSVVMLTSSIVELVGETKGNPSSKLSLYICLSHRVLL